MLGIIIIDPDPMVNRILTETAGRFPDLGIFACVKNLEQLTQAMEQKPARLIIGETTLADGTLYEWIRSRRAEGDAVDFLPVTGDDSPDTFRRLRQAGAVDYIIKPFSENRLQEGLARYLQMIRALRPDRKLSQKGLDRLLIPAPLPHMESAARGSGKTMARVKACIQGRSGETFTVEQIMQETGLSETTVRRYLERFLQEGHLEMLSDYGRVGRPLLRYRWIIRRDRS